MGRAKEQWMDEQNDRQNQENIEKLAAYFGFDAADVAGLDIELNEDHGSSDAGALYGYYVTLPDDTPQHVKDLVGDGQLPVNFFEDRDDDHEGFIQDEQNGFLDMDPSNAKAQADQLRKDQGEDTEA